LVLVSHASAGELRGSLQRSARAIGWVAALLQATAVTNVTTSATYDADRHRLAIFARGYAFSNNFRAELGAGYRHNEIEGLREISPAWRTVAGRRS
jgi:hypothetical protein